MDKLDLTQPLEAVHRDSGAVVLVSLKREVAGDGFFVTPDLEGGWFFFELSGRHSVKACPWFIRNADVTAKPSTPSNEELTQRMEISPELAQRMADHLRECAARPMRRPTRDLTAQKLYDDLYAILADLPKPVDPIDPDEHLALTMVRRHYPEVKDSYRGRRFHVALEAIREGRTLAAGGTAHE